MSKAFVKVFNFLLQMEEVNDIYPRAGNCDSHVDGGWVGTGTHVLLSQFCGGDFELLQSLMLMQTETVGMPG